MPGWIIFLIVEFFVLWAVIVIHFLCVKPIDFQDWFIEEYGWLWILGTIVSFAILYGFILWSWKKMLLIFAAIIGFAVIVASIYYVCKTYDDRKSKKMKKQTELFENKIYNSVMKLMKYPKITNNFYKEKQKFQNHLNSIKKRLDESNIILLKEFDINIDQVSQLRIKDFIASYNEELFKFEGKIVKLRDKDKLPSLDRRIKAFFSNNYDKVNEIILITGEYISKSFMVKNGKVEEKELRTLEIYDRLPDYLLQALKMNIQPYIDLFEVENFLRIYINIKYFKKYENYGLENLFKYAHSAQKKANTRMLEDEKQGWKTPRGKTIIFYVDFSELCGLITNGDNWNLFKDDFKDQDFIKLRINELYEMRNKVAHNSILSSDEITNAIAWCDQIYNQLSKYKDEIKNWTL